MSRRWIKRLLAWGMLVLFFALLADVGPAQAWWDGKWKYRKKITLDTTAQGADIKEALTDFPVLVRLHSANFNFGNAKGDGSDLRFVSADDKTPLKYHVERYDQKMEMAFVWVKLPRLASATNQESVWLYYGNSSVADGQEGGGTYDTPQIAVYHFGEKEGSPRDSTAYGNHAKEFTGALNAPVIIGPGITFKGEGERMVIARSPSLNFSKGFTFSIWVRMAKAQQDARLFSWDDGKQSLLIGIEGTKLYCALSAQGKKTGMEKTIDLPQQRWVHVAVTAEPGKSLTVYTDGKEKVSAKVGSTLPEPASDISIGASLQGKNAFAGILDEVEISGVARSAAWIRAIAVSQGAETPLLSYQEEEASSGAGESLTIHLLVVTARAITLDGWLIIGGIVIMIGITWILFFNKFMLLRKMKKENNVFFESFTGTDDMHSMRDKDDDFENSSLYRVYRAGLGELDRRLEKIADSGDRKILPIHAITAFNASLEKASLQESKRNAAGLLLFTLSISGGPFMGLFGTVWGVINTFAGVAEAGEANLAAIAPGVASALACTLMGLALAIPALFQYTYLASEIKSSTADMNVFMGEFTTWVEEEYGGKHE